MEDPDFEDEGDLNDDLEDDAFVLDAFTLQNQCKNYAPNYPEWVKRDVAQYIKFYGSDLNKLSKFLEIDIGTLIVWKRKFMT